MYPNILLYVLPYNNGLQILNMGCIAELFELFSKLKKRQVIKYNLFNSNLIPRQ